MAKKRRRKYSRGAGTEVEREMRRYKRGTAKRGKGGRGGKVTSRKQAIAIGLSEARKKGKKVPRKKKVPVFRSPTFSALQPALVCSLTKRRMRLRTHRSRSTHASATTRCRIESRERCPCPNVAPMMAPRSAAANVQCKG